MKLTREYIDAEERLKQAMHTAKMMGIVRSDAGSDDYGPEDDERVEDGPDSRDARLLDKKKRIQAWVDQGAERLFAGGREAVVSEVHRTEPDRRAGYEGRCLAPFGDGIEPCLDELEPEGEGRKWLDE